MTRQNEARSFTTAALTGETAAAAMNFRSNSEAVIIDLRKNGGGDPATVSLIASYLFGPQPVHLNDLYNRQRDETQQYWTLAYVPGRRINLHFIIGVPSGRPINPITKADWEGTGVVPDVKVPAEQALSTAHLMALEKVLPTLSDAPGLKAEAEREIERLKQELGK